MRKWLARIVAAFCLALLVLLPVLWAHLRLTHDDYLTYDARHPWGRVWLVPYRLSFSFESRHVFASPPMEGIAERDWKAWVYYRFEWADRPVAPAGPWPGGVQRNISIRWWAVLLVLALWPVRQFRTEYRRWQHRPSQDSAALPCPKCGYDLRAHAPGSKCPECGTVIPVPAASQLKV